MIKITVRETRRETRFLTNAETLLWNIGKKAKNDDNYQIIAKIDSYFDKLRITDTPAIFITENGKTQIRVEFESIIERPATKDENKKIFEKFLTGKYGSFNERGKQFQSNPEVIIKEHENPDIDSYILRLKNVVEK